MKQSYKRPRRALEVARVLAPNGTFLTQQVHGLWAHDLYRLDTDEDLAFSARKYLIEATKPRA